MNDPSRDQSSSPGPHNPGLLMIEPLISLMPKVYRIYPEKLKPDRMPFVYPVIAGPVMPEAQGVGLLFYETKGIHPTSNSENQAR